MSRRNWDLKAQQLADVSAQDFFAVFAAEVELLGPVDAGLVFQEEDVKDLRDKMIMLMENPELRENLKKKGYERAASLYTWEAIARDTYKTYQIVADAD